MHFRNLSKSQPVEKSVQKFIFAKKTIYYTFQMILSRFEQKQFFLIFWWNTRLRLTMGAIPYIHFLNPLMFCITGYKWTSLPSMVISEWLVCTILCSKDDTFRKNPEILWFSANLGVVPHVQFFEIKFLT